MPKKSSKELFELLLRDTENHVISHIRKTMGDQYLKERKLGPYKPKSAAFQLDVATIGDWPPVKHQPASLTNCTMRDYQVQGLNWLIRLFRTGLNGILADEMGLGKTLQTISLLAYLRENKLSNGPHLVLVPLTTLSNWLREFKKFCPELEVIRFHGDPAYRSDMVDNVISKGKFDVCVTTYEMASREKVHLKKVNWSYIIVDEAHRLKNENSLLSRVLREYKSANRLLITGTPLQNTLKDVWSLLNFLLPSIFNNSDDFDSLFQSVENDAGVVRVGKKAGDNDEDDDDDDIDDAEAEELAKKEQYEEERQALKANSTTSTVQNDANSTARGHRAGRKGDDDDDAMSLALKKQQVRAAERDKVATGSGNGPNNNNNGTNNNNNGDEIEDDADEGFKTEVLGKLHTILRPFVLRRLKADVATDLPPKKEIYIHVPMTALQRKVYHDIIVGNFDSLGGVSKQRQKLLNVVIQLRKCCNHPYLFDGIEDESLPALGEHLISTSGKMIILDKLLTKLFSTGDATAIPPNQSKVLIFCQMTTQLNILEDFCNYRGYPSCRIDGSTESYNREALMEEFNRPGSPRKVFLLSTRAGGVGINLVAADTVILYDSDWNPQMDLQAMDRAHRLGQTRPVNVYRFIVKDSIEERVTMRAEAKLRLDQMVIQSGRTPTSNNAMSTGDMVDLIRSGVNNIFSADSSDSLDEDIESILTRGEDKTKEITSKLEKFKGFELSLSAPVVPDRSTMTDGDDGTNDDPNQESTAEQNQRLREMLGHTSVDGDITEQLQKEHEAYLAQLAKDEEDNNPNKRMTNRSQYEQERYFLQLFADAKSEIPQPMTMKYQRIHECQLYNYPRLEEINQIEQDLYDKFISDAQSYARRSLLGEELQEPDFKSYVLSESLKEERERILTDGFPTWSFFEYKAFIRGSEKYGRNAYDLIAQEIGSKSASEVKLYSNAFFKRYLWIKDGKKVVAGIELAETKVFAANALVPYLTPMVDHLHSPFDAQKHFSGVALPSTIKNKAYTEEIDGLCLYTVARDGFQANSIKDSIMLSSSLSFDYFARTRLPADLYRRVETIGRQFAPKTLQKKRGGPPKRTNQDMTGSALATLANSAAGKQGTDSNSNGSVETRQELDEDGNPITVDLDGNVVQPFKRRPTRQRNTDVSYLE